MIQGFKDFIARGNALEMAVGIVIGAAFGAVVEALTDKVLNPLIGAIFGQPDLDRIVVISTRGGEILPGAILTALINFLLIAAAVYFLVVVPVNKLAERNASAEEEDDTPEDVALLSEIRDLLANPRG
ncbi:MAG TPA: large conductance mechanosensitive channel protein MscL [Beutenbergiaceae bacterium]|nr:large conductance mechanosensitive channel protein MscL [Beutenbergiaceae bacterium]